MAEQHILHIHTSKSSTRKGMNSNELTSVRPETMINVTQAGEIRGRMRCLNAPYPASCRVQMTRGASGP